MLENGWIKLHRQVTQWEWYSDIPCKVLFFHLLLTVNYEDKKWQGTIVKRGERITSIAHLAAETNLSVQEVRTALKKLESTGEIARSSTSKWTRISVEKYALYQVGDSESNKQTTNEQQTSNNNERKQESKNNIRLSPEPLKKAQGEEPIVNQSNIDRLKDLTKDLFC